MIHFALVALIIPLGQVPAPPQKPDARAEWRAVLADEAKALHALADRLDREMKPAVAKEIRLAAALPSFSAPERFAVLPEFEPPQQPTGGLARVGASEPSGNAEFRAIRLATAAKLLALARSAAAANPPRFAIADRSLRDALARAPEDAEVRRLLGYVATKDGGWATQHAAALLDRGMVPHPTFGWVDKSWVPHLERGELPGLVIGSRVRNWTKAEIADELRSESIDDGWQISTAPHFDVRTNAPLAEGVALARQLEALFDAFFSLCPDLIPPDRLPLAQRLASGTTTRPTGRKHQVWYFAEHEQYVDFFKRLGVDESISLGYYMPAEDAKRARLAASRAYFFRDPDGEIESQATLFHEASHQLLFETAGPARLDRNIGNYWVWEGLGTYFESLRRMDDGSYTIGGWFGPRLQQASARLAVKRERIPIREFAALGRAEFGDDKRVYLHYAQAMALVVFFMHADDGRFRDAFLDYVRDAYQGRARPNSLVDRIGIEPEQLDRMFDRYVRDATPQTR